MNLKQFQKKGGYSRYEQMTPEQQKAHIEKMSKARKDMWDKKTAEEKAEHIRKMTEGTRNKIKVENERRIKEAGINNLIK